MNEELLTALLTDIDPVRNLSDDALDELLPFNHLMKRVLYGIGQPATDVVRARTSIWHSASLRISAVAATVVLVASGAVAFLGSSPTSVSGGFALGTVHSSWVQYGTSRSTGGNYGTATRNMAAALVGNGRIKTVLHLNGLAIAPPQSSTKPQILAKQMAEDLWATTSLRGQTKVAFGIGDITLNILQGGVSKLQNVPVWVAIATSKPCSPASVCSVLAIASLPLTVVVSGYGLPNSEAATGTPIAFTYQTKGVNSTTAPRLLPAIEQVSIPWVQDGRVTNGRLHITAAPVPCGELNGFSLATDTNGTTLTVMGLVPVSTIGDYCTASAAANKIILLRGASVNIAKFLHAQTGAIQATQ